MQLKEVKGLSLGKVVAYYLLLFCIPICSNSQSLTDQQLDSINAYSLDYFYSYPDSAFRINRSLYKRISNSTSDLTVSNIQTVTGTMYQQLGQYDSALHYLFKAYELRKDLGLEEKVATAEYNIANTFYYSDQLLKAIDYHKKSINRRLSLSDSFKTALAYNSLALVYQDINYVDSAAATYLKAEAYLNDSLKHNSWLACDLYCNLAKFYEELNKTDLSAKYLYQAYQLNKKLGDQFQKAWIYHHWGILKQYEGHYRAARSYLDSAYHIANDLNDVEQMHEIEQSYIKLTFKEYGDLAANHMLNRFLDHSDSLQKWKVNENINRLETEFQVKQKESELALAETENEQKQIRIYWLLASLLLLLISGFLVFRNYRKRQQVTELSLSLKNKELDELLRKQEIERVNALLKGQNKERQRIAQELHDRLGSLLLAAKLQYQKLERQLQKALEEQHKSQSQLNNLLQEATEEVRRISHDLYEGSLAQFGYVSAFNQLKDAIEAANPIKIHFEHNDLPEVYYKEFETELYRITQELLSNTLKYAEAGKIEIIFTLLEERFIFQYRDDGKGFDLEQVNQGAGIGFKNIKDRVARIGGEMKLNSEPEGGMQFQLKVKASHGGNNDDFS